MAIAAIPVGLGLGFGLSAMLVKAYDSELYRLPLVVTPSAYALTMLTVIIAALVSSLIIYQQLQNIDLIAVLKTRE